MTPEQIGKTEQHIDPKKQCVRDGYKQFCNCDFWKENLNWLYTENKYLK